MTTASTSPNTSTYHALKLNEKYCCLHNHRSGYFVFVFFGHDPDHGRVFYYLDNKRVDGFTISDQDGINSGDRRSLSVLRMYWNALCVKDSDTPLWNVLPIEQLPKDILCSVVKILIDTQKLERIM